MKRRLQKIQIKMFSLPLFDLERYTNWVSKWRRENKQTVIGIPLSVWISMWQSYRLAKRGNRGISLRCCKSFMLLKFLIKSNCVVVKFFLFCDFILAKCSIRRMSTDERSDSARVAWQSKPERNYVQWENYGNCAVNLWRDTFYGNPWERSQKSNPQQRH